MNEIVFTVPGIPIPKDRPRASIVTKKRAHGLGSYTTGNVKHSIHMRSTNRSKSYECLVGESAKQQVKNLTLLKCPVSLFVEFYFPVTPSWSNKKKACALAGELAHTTKPDADNCLKAICDALNGIIWKDDALIIEKHVYKFYSDTPCAKVWVVPLNHLKAVQDY